jgi:putative transcriptional regulator
VLNRFDEVFAQLVDLPDAPPALALWQARLSPPARLHSGGPVGGDSLIALAEAHRSDRPTWQLGDRAVGTLDLLDDSTGPGGPGVALRVFRGYSGWSPGQLEGELDAGAWMVFDAVFDDVFSASPARLWRNVMRRQGGTTAWLADAPDDLSAN